MKYLIVILVLSLGLSSCAVQKGFDQKFGDQHFKTSVALIELHKVRFGEYPNSLKDLKFVGEWDQIALANVQYKKLANGYELDVVKGWVGKPELNYPDEFWKGLGLVSSNINLSWPAPEQALSGLASERSLSLVAWASS